MLKEIRNKVFYIGGKGNNSLVFGTTLDPDFNVIQVPAQIKYKDIIGYRTLEYLV